MRPASLVRGVVIAVGAVYSVVLGLSGVDLDSVFKIALGWLPAAASLLLVVWDLWVWRIGPFQKAVHRPRIDGLWKASLRPTEESHIPPGGNRGPIDAYVVVRQSYWSLHIRQLTKESSSDSRAVFWQRPAGSDVDRLTFLYENDARPEHRARSPRHLGSCSFATATLLPSSILGTYFTDRYTQGEMQLELVDRTVALGTFDEADQHTKHVQAAAAPQRDSIAGP